jgi:hypothetical protein
MEDSFYFQEKKMQTDWQCEFQPCENFIKTTFVTLHAMNIHTGCRNERININSIFLFSIITAKSFYSCKISFVLVSNSYSNKLAFIHVNINLGFVF